MNPRQQIFWRQSKSQPRGDVYERNMNPCIVWDRSFAFPRNGKPFSSLKREMRRINNKQTKGNKPKNYNWKRKYLHSFLRAHKRHREAELSRLGMFSRERRRQSTFGRIYGFSLPREKRFLGCRNKLTRKRCEQRYFQGMDTWTMVCLQRRIFRWTQIPQISFELRIRKIPVENQNLPDLGAGFCWSSMACSKKRFLSETVLGVRADGGGVGDWNLSRRMTGKTKKKHKIKIKINSSFKNQFGGTKEIERKKIGDEWKIASLKLS